MQMDYMNKRINKMLGTNALIKRNTNFLRIFTIAIENNHLLIL